MAERVRAYGAPRPRRPAGLGDAYAGQIEQGPDRRAALATAAEGAEVPQPEQRWRGGVQPRPGRASDAQRRDLRAVAAGHRRWTARRAGRRSGARSRRSGRRSRPGPERTASTTRSAGSTRFSRRTAAAGSVATPGSRSTWATCPRACTPASVRPAQTSRGAAGRRRVPGPARAPARPGPYADLPGPPSRRRRCRRSRRRAANEPRRLPGVRASRRHRRGTPSRHDGRSGQDGPARHDPALLEPGQRPASAQRSAQSRSCSAHQIGLIAERRRASARRSLASRWPAATRRPVLQPGWPPGRRTPGRSAAACGAGPWATGRGRRSRARPARARASRWVSPSTASAAPAGRCRRSVATRLPTNRAIAGW